jgi:WD40 repeat protein
MRHGAGWIVLLSAAAISSCAPAARAQDVHKVVTIATPGKIRSMSVCGTSGLAAGLSGDGTIYVWRLPSGELTASWKADGVSSLACSFDGKWVAIGKRDGSVEISDAAGKPARTLASGHTRIEGLAFSPDGSLLAASRHEQAAQLWSPGDGKLVAELQTDFSGVTSMDFAPDSSLFATADADTTVKIYDRNGKLKAKYAGLLLEPFAISFLPDGKKLIFAGADCTITLLDATNGRVIKQFPRHPDPIFQIAALPDGQSALSLHIDSARLEKFTVVLWNLRTSARRDLQIDGENLVGYGENSHHRAMLFTTDSDASLTAWEILD